MPINVMMPTFGLFKNLTGFLELEILESGIFLRVHSKLFSFTKTGIKMGPKEKKIIDTTKAYS